MTQLNAPMARGAGRPDVYTALLAVAALVMVTAVIFMALGNIEQTQVNGRDGSPLKYLER